MHWTATDKRVNDNNSCLTCSNVCHGIATDLQLHAFNIIRLCYSKKKKKKKRHCIIAAKFEQQLKQMLACIACKIAKHDRSQCHFQCSNRICTSCCGCAMCDSIKAELNYYLDIANNINVKFSLSNAGTYVGGDTFGV